MITKMEMVSVLGSAPIILLEALLKEYPEILIEDPSITMSNYMWLFIPENYNYDQLLGQIHRSFRQSEGLRVSGRPSYITWAGTYYYIFNVFNGGEISVFPLEKVQVKGRISVLDTYLGKLKIINHGSSEAGADS